MGSDNQDLVQRENALRFFTEMCQLLKNVQLNRSPMQCTKDFGKIVIVLAETFNIMVPDMLTLKAEINHDFDTLISVYENREKVKSE